MKLKTLAEIVNVKSRFGRSVNLERDFYRDISLDGYVLTTTSRQALEILLHARSNANAARAFSLTGPYGSGKSTFALFLAKVFGDEDRTSGGFQILKEGAPDLCEILEEKSLHFFPILVSSAREPIALAILRGIEMALHTLSGNEAKKLLKRAAVLRKNKKITGNQLIKFLARISDSINKGNRDLGILLIVDELGKLLEYAALNNEKSDIYLLQELAESTRFFNTPFFLITILHQALRTLF